MAVTHEVRSEEAQLQALQRLDEECVQLQVQGNYVAALECMERALVRHACKAVSELCNLLSMTFLQQENYAVTIELLKKAEILTEHLPEERATTLNNMACYYRRIGKLHGALNCLKRALEIELRIQKVSATADTHLNLCAVYSTMGKHPSALEHAQAALIVLHEELFSQGKDLEQLDHRRDRVSVLCIAYHNIGVEYEYLKQFSHSVASYQKALGIAEQYLGPVNGVTITLTNSYTSARRTLQTKAKREAKGSPTKKQPSPGKSATRVIGGSFDFDVLSGEGATRLGDRSPSRKELPPLASISKINEAAAATIAAPAAPAFLPLTPHSAFFSPRSVSPVKPLHPLPDATLNVLDDAPSPTRRKVLEPLPTRASTPDG
ncbi:hypothetical protein SPRG_10054 [Saprolegnia parasitica CBS 223.65]|uniref:MalT-like TPR region domain-containing protein n=1 Tax=Saprolegnia parasitica (strain CBS 223.65) TaxID=695850 RepID=A0A067BZE2_SAPPC|nr:hypothetical protein SPRG_10054 [Saprolegnia parasitica CBS 223.65]KDO23909.1 hypothetical protein SPRG_10054 [Saprolegnia parasitica CBS 223.65]|eukprot:XP_012205377.1 hypothetical protein SPRG_10054 [Saprolegnia parasitica CBS 223.65]